MTTPLTLAAEGIALTFSSQGGVVHPLTVTDEGAVVSPLHAAPWTEAEVPAEAPPHQRRLRGDFLAAPMGAGPEGLHGLAANGDWVPLPSAPGTLRALLQGQILGATVVKELLVSDGHPFLYQRHLFVGGRGALPLANHAMVSVPSGAKLSFSRKRWFETLPAPLELDPSRGRSASPGWRRLHAAGRLDIH